MTKETADFDEENNRYYVSPLVWIAPLIVAGYALMIFGTPYINKQINAFVAQVGYTTETCDTKEGKMEAVSTGLFGSATKTVCLLPNGSTFTIRFN